MSSSPAPGLELSARRRIDRPSPRVWWGLTTKAAVEQWWSPEDLRTTVRRLEVRQGGSIDFRVRYLPALLTRESAASFQAAGVPISFDLLGHFARVEPERLLEFDLTLRLDKDGSGVPMFTRFELEPGTGTSEVRVTATGPDSPHWRSLGQKNLESQLERLDRVVRGAAAGA